MKKITNLLLFLLCANVVVGQFGLPNRISNYNSIPKDAKAYDIDGDGDLDVIVSSPKVGEELIAWYENDGNGNIANEHVISTSALRVEAIYAADLDNDGDLDVIAGGSVLAWYENYGGGVFSGPKLINNNVTSINCVSAADIDNDGDIDIFSNSNNPTKTFWHENLGGGMFSIEKDIQNLKNYIQLKDIDNDGDIDLLLNRGGYIGWVKNLGGALDTVVTTIFSTSQGVDKVVYEDLDNDGDLDVISTSSNYDKVRWHQNLGGAIFLPEQLIGGNIDGASDVLVFDYDGDGDKDVVTSSINDKEINWFENLGSTVFSSKQLIQSYATTTSLFAADFNNDTQIDILATFIYKPSVTDKGKLVWYKNHGAGAFSQMINITSNTFTVKEINLVDIDLDGNIDVVSASKDDNKVAWYKNLGGGNFGQQYVINNNVTQISSTFSADLDNDGDLDVLTASRGDGIIAWYENLGGGNFDTIVKIIDSSSVPLANAVMSFDVDMDGDMDVIAASGGNSTIVWYENLGGGIFGNQQIIGIMGNAGDGGFEGVDLDNDGDLDILEANPGSIVFWENYGNGTFSTAQIVISGQNNLKKSLGVDIDGDGLKDILSADFNANEVFWLKNLGGLSFGSKQIINTTYTTVEVRGFDIDGDSDNDVIISDLFTDEIYWFENLGGGVFATAISISDYYHHVSAMEGVDLDNDGDLDLVVGSYGDDKLAWHENYFISQFQINGSFFYDDNQNKLIDSNDYGLSYIQAQLSPNGFFNYSWNNGNYYFAVDSGSYNLNYSPLNNLWKLTTDSLTYSPVLTVINPIADSLNFGFYPDSIATIIEADLTGGFHRCNSTINYWVNLKNLGTTNPSGIIHLELDSNALYSGSLIAPDSINGNNLYWSYDSLLFFENKYINLSVSLPNVTFMGNEITSILNVHEIVNNNYVYSISDTLSEILVCAYDPNDKKVIPEGLGKEGYIKSNHDLEYLVRFQNTGNDTAITVVIRDQLDADLDWTSLEIISNSHPMQVSITPYGRADFKFENIWLPDSGANELASHGFVKFKIKQKQDLLPGMQIINGANIYFDFNPAIVTNTVINTIYDCDSVYLNINDTEFCKGDVISAFSGENFPYNNYLWTLDTINVSMSDSLNFITDSSGVFMLMLNVNNPICNKDSVMFITVNELPFVILTNFSPDTICSNGSAVALPNVSPSGGIYSGTGVSGGTFDPNIAGVGTHNVIYTYIDTNSCINSDSTFITVEQCVGIDDLANDFGILIYPNPNTGLFTIEKSSELDKEINISLLDASSRVIIDKIIPKGQQKTEMDITSYSKGIYYLQLTVGKEVFVKKILKN